MDLESLKKRVLRQAKEKGFGIKPKDIVVAEKLILIHSEISEVYQGYLQKNLAGRQGLAEETGDALQRILHLGGIFKVDFSRLPKISKQSFLRQSMEKTIASFHLLISETWEHYRRGRWVRFKSNLVKLASLTLLLAESCKFSLEEVIDKKLRINQKRSWAKEHKPNEKFIFKS